MESMKVPEFRYSPPPVPFKLFDDPLKVLIEFYKEHIHRDIDGAKLAPAEFWVVLRGLLTSAAQIYTAVCLLLSEKRPKRLMLQAAILNRSLLETLGNVLALCEAPKSKTRILVREAYKNLVLMFLRDQAKHGGSDPKWNEYLDVYAKGLESFAKGLRISRRYLRNPNLISEQWPTPGRMIHGDKRRKQPPFLHGNRRKVFKIIYDSHYGHQSEQAHQRAAAVSAALVVDDPSAQWNPGYGESTLISDAILFLTCILSELESKGRYPAHPKLQELWVYVRELNDEAKELWRLRYRSLLKA
jgi:hypothetical protein